MLWLQQSPAKHLEYEGLQWQVGSSWSWYSWTNLPHNRHTKVVTAYACLCKNESCAISHTLVVCNSSTATDHMHLIYFL